MLIDREFLVEIDARNSSGVTETLRFSKDGYITARSDTPSDTVYEPRVSNPGALSLYLWDAGTTGGSSVVGWGAIVLQNADSGLDYLLTDGYGVAGVAVRVKIGTPGAALSTFSTIFTGTAESIEFDDDGMVRLAVRDKQHLLSNRSLQSNLYAGSNSLPNGVEGMESDLKGKGKPRLYGGLSRNFAPPLVNTSRLLYEISDQKIDSIEGVFENGVEIPAGFEYTRTRITGDGSVPFTFQKTFSSANVSAANDTITISGLTFTAGDAITFSHSIPELFPSPLDNFSSTNYTRTKTYYVYIDDYFDVYLFTTKAAAEAFNPLSPSGQINITNSGYSGIDFLISIAGSVDDVVAINTSNDTLILGSGSFASKGSSAYLMLSASVPVLPSPIVAQQTYYMGGSGTTFTLHSSKSDAVAGSNKINLTTAGLTGETFTATIYSSTTATSVDDWLDFAQSGVSVASDTITFAVAHGILLGQAVKVRKKTIGTLPTPLSTANIYYASPTSSTALKLYPTRADAVANTNVVNITATGSSDTNQMSVNTVAPGEYCWCNDADGCVIRLGTKPTGMITVDAIAEQSVSGTATGTWVDFSQANTFVGSNYIITSTAHGMTTGDSVFVRKKTVGTLPAPLAADTVYFVRAPTTTVLEFFETYEDAIANANIIDITNNGSADLNQVGKCDISYIPVGVGSLLKKIAMDAGVEEVDINSADVAALDSAISAGVSECLVVDDKRSARRVMDSVAGSVGAWYVFDASGELRMGRLIAPGGAPALEIDDSVALSVGRFASGDDGKGVPYWRIVLQYAPSIVVQTRDQLNSAAEEDRVAFVGREWREAVAEDSAVLDVHPGAPERRFSTKLTLASVASDEAARRQALYGVRRDLLRVKVPLTEDVSALALGSVVKVTYPLLGLSAGRLTVLLGVETDWMDNVVTLVLWG